MTDHMIGRSPKRRAASVHPIYFARHAIQSLRIGVNAMR